jgi:hypothetical protein
LREFDYRDVLVSDVDDVADKLANEILEPGHATGQLGGGVSFGPEVLELTHLQQIGQDQRLLYFGLLQVFLAEQGLAAHKVGVRKVGQGLQEDPNHDLTEQQGRGE